MALIPKNITREHCLKAIAEIDKEGVPDKFASTKFDLVDEERRYPPKLVIRWANKYANGEELTDFSGGFQSNSFLRRLKFTIKPKVMLNPEKFQKCFDAYLKACTETGWLYGDEAYKFRFANWLHERVDFDKQTDEEIYQLCLTSQEQPYTKDSNEKGVNFITSEKRFKDTFIRIEDIAKILLLREEANYSKENLSNTSMTLPKFSVWLGTLLPNKFRIYASIELQSALGYLFNLTNYPKTGFPAFDFAQDLLFILSEELKKKSAELKKIYGPLLKEFGREQFEDIDWVWITQDFNLHIVRNIIPLVNTKEIDGDFSKLGTDTMNPNIILYGPPGTGKTYHTKDLAIRLIESLTEKELKKKHPTRKKLNDIYSKNVEKEQIKFVTFHQSFSYEDFIEGIKPELVNDDATSDGEVVANVRYKIEEGVFKLICDRAKNYQKFVESERILVEPQADEDLKNAKFFKMSLGNTAIPEDNAIYKYCIENECVALGWGSDIDFTGIESKEEIEKRLAKNGSVSKFEVFAIKCLIFWMRINDYVFISDGNTRVRAIGRVAGDYYFNDTTPIRYNHFRKVQWIASDVSIPVSEIYQKSFSQQTIYMMWGDLVNLEFLRAHSKQDPFLKNHVLIIDEINRGNISNIFGELITLIEKDKRVGAPEELEITLPYSKSPFSVPPNLYIIGTMNTADRSVEALDAALRRRFSFIEMKPKPELLASHLMLWRLWEIYEDSGWAEEPYKTKEHNLLNFLEGTIIDEKAYRKLGDDESVRWHIPSPFDGIVDFKGLDLAKMLATINTRLERLLDEDHTIGHSFFLGLEDSEDIFESLKQVFQNNVIPLLKEFFYGDFSKIGLVLGGKFVEAQIPSGEDLTTEFARDLNYGPEYEWDEKTLYRFTSAESWKIEAFKKIYAKEAASSI